MMELMALVEDQSALCRMGEIAIVEDDLNRLALMAGTDPWQRSVQGRSMIYFSQHQGILHGQHRVCEGPGGRDSTAGAWKGGGDLGGVEEFEGGNTDKS